MGEDKAQKQYRGRLAPTPSGYLHEGNIKTFQVAMQRANNANGKLFLRIDDLDSARCKQEYIDACLEDLASSGLIWNELAERQFADGICRQSYRMQFYLDALQELIKTGLIYPCNRTRSEIRKAGIKSHSGDESLYPEKWRNQFDYQAGDSFSIHQNWRAITNWGERIEFRDGRLGEIDFEMGKDFSDFLVWRKDGFPAYELATVVDDHLMEITEIVRGEDLLVSSARQCLLFDYLHWTRPEFYHCSLSLAKDGTKLSKSSRIIPRLFPSF
jgi:glutamyl-tRNA synthetase